MGALLKYLFGIVCDEFVNPMRNVLSPLPFCHLLDFTDLFSDFSILVFTSYMYELLLSFNRDWI